MNAPCAGQTRCTPDMHFRNAEMHTFEGGRLKSIEVFFGDPPNGLTRREFAVQCGPG